MTLAASIRLALALMACVLALPQVLTFPSMPLFKWTLVVSEWGHRLALFPLLVLIWAATGSGKEATASGWISLTAIGLLIWPLLQAVPTATTVRDEAAVWEAPDRRGVFDWGSLFLSAGPPPAEFEEWNVPRPSSQIAPLRLLFSPALDSTRPAPCILLVHGGGWERGDPNEFPRWVRHWNEQGHAVVSIDYRLAPESQWPAPLEDVELAIQHLKSEGVAQGIDPSRLVLIGRSAGSQIAAVAASHLRDPAIVGCVALYGPADMVFAWENADPEDILDSPRLLRQYMGGSSDEFPERYHQASPAFLIHPGTPPTLLAHGRRDILVWNRQSEKMQAALKANQVRHQFVDLPWATHAFDYPFHGPGSQIFRFALDRFLADVTRPGAAESSPTGSSRTGSGVTE